MDRQRVGGHPVEQQHRLDLGLLLEIVELAQLHPLNVEVVVPVSVHGRIVRGMQATVRPELPFEGDRIATVIIVDGAVDAASGTFGVRLELPNPKRELPGGLKCVVEFAGEAPAG